MRQAMRTLIVLEAKVQGGGAVNWSARVVLDPTVLSGKPVVRGTRLSVQFIVGLLAQGWSTAQIVQEYEQLAVEDIQACLAYASDLLQTEHVYPLPR